MDVSKISKRWNNHKRYQDTMVNSLGKLLLLARRLAERGAGFITVTTNFVWDMHAQTKIMQPCWKGWTICRPSL